MQRPSGMSATHAVFSALSPGDRVFIPTDTYFGTTTLLKSHFERWGLEVATVDLTQPEEAAAGITSGTRLVWIETPSNPRIAMTSIGDTVKLAHSAGALTACDNTWATPILQRPFEFGVDIVVHSTTKYLAGHSDTMGGVVIFREASELTQRVRDQQTVAGIVPSPLDCWLVRRGLYTLSCRMRTHCENAQALAEHLSTNPKVERVHYPGLTSDPGHEVATSQMNGFGGMLSVILPGGRDRAFAVASRLKLIRRATSLGGPESLVEHRASIEGPETQAPEGLLRVSVGLEHIDDLCSDFDQALETPGD